MVSIYNIKEFLEEKKLSIKENNHRFDKFWYIVIDNNDIVRYSESINILTQENLKHRIICIEESWQNYRGFYDYSAKNFYSIDENGDIHKDLIVDGWILTFSNYYMQRGDFMFCIEKQSDILSTLNHFWKTFQIVKLCTSKTEFDCFKKAYQMAIDKNKYIEEAKDKDHEIEFLKKQIKNYEDMFTKLTQLLDGAK